LKYKVIFKEEAMADVREAWFYYEEKLPGLGDRFLISLEKRKEDLENHPEHYGFIEGDNRGIYRDVRLDRFPYLVTYEITGEEVIVYSVFFARANPGSRRLG
jgi:plasmid stabilization system protein ParE